MHKTGSNFVILLVYHCKSVYATLMMFDGIIATRNLMKNGVQYLLYTDRNSFQRKFLESDFERPDYGSREKPLALDIRNGAQHIIVYNSHGQDSDEVVSFFLEGIKKIPAFLAEKFDVKRKFQILQSCIPMTLNGQKLSKSALLCGEDTKDYFLLTCLSQGYHKALNGYSIIFPTHDTF